MHIYFAIPAYKGIVTSDGLPICAPFLEALYATMELAKQAGHRTSLGVLSGCCYVQIARNELVKQFRESDADAMVFLDDDLSWTPSDLLRLIERDDEVVAGIYRYKTEREDYPVVVHTDEQFHPKARGDGAIAAACVPTGMLIIRRSAIEKLCAAYPQQGYFKHVDGEKIEGYFDLFPQGLKGGQWVGEDFAFCRLWTDIGGEIWIVPDINITHWNGDKPFPGNYHRFLLNCPGGSGDPTL